MAETKLKRQKEKKPKGGEIIPFQNRASWVNNVGSGSERINDLELQLAQKETEIMELKASEGKFRAVFDHLFQFIGVLDAEGKVMEANRRITRFSGLNEDKIAGKNFWSIGLFGKTPSEVKAIRDLTLKAAEGEMIRREIELSGCMGKDITIDFSISPVFDESGNVVMLIPEARDISDRKMMENALMETAGYYRSLFENAHDAIIIIDPASEKVLDVNNQACEYYGFTRSEFLQLSLDQITCDIKQGKKRIKELIAKGKISNYESKYTSKEGKQICMEVNATLFSFHGHEAILCMMRNISDRKNLEDQVLSAAIMAQDLERRRFSTELHDGLGQLLSAVRMQFHFLLNARERMTTQEQEVLDTSLTVLQRAMQEVRSISWNLMPASLERFGLVVCLDELGDMVSIASGVEIQSAFKGILPEERMPETLELGIFRVVQELINNAIKHAQATLIQFSLVRKENELHLELKDNGTGMIQKKERQAGTGNGLRNLNSRVKLLGGSIDFYSKAGKGTKVIVILPIRERYEN